MQNRMMAAALLGLALAGAAAPAQDTARAKVRPEQRVQISKGEVMLAPRVDTVYLTRHDTVVVTKRETIRVPYALVEIDTIWYPVEVTRAPASQPPKTMYWALHTGMTMPSGNLDRLYTNGFHAGAGIGWDDDFVPLGARFTAAVTQLSRENGALRSVVGTTTPMLVSGELDLKLMAPDLEWFRLYGVGGATFSTFKGLAMVSKRGRGVGNADGRGGWFEPVSGSGWNTAMGFNLGAGTDLRIANQELFLEARAVALQAHGARTWFIPVSFGVRLFE